MKGPEWSPAGWRWWAVTLVLAIVFSLVPEWGPRLGEQIARAAHDLPTVGMPECVPSVNGDDR